MADDRFSLQRYWERVTENWQPELSFTGGTKEDWAAWVDKALPRLKELIGRFPDPVDPEPVVEYSVEHGDLIRERVVLRVDQYMWMPCILLRPKDAAPDRSRPAVLAVHGHGNYGKNPVAGFVSGPGVADDIRIHNYNYGEQIAKAGYVTICPDLRGFGERAGPPLPGRDPCNVRFIQGALLGIWTLTLNIWDMMKAIDYLQSLPEVDPERIGMVGLSQGGTMTTFTAALDPRVKAAVVSGYINPWRSFAIERDAFCGSQFVPSIHRYFDTHDIAGLIAPRALLVEMGMFDVCFYIEDMLQGFECVRKIYEAAGAADRLWKDVHPGYHAYSGARTLDFFRKFL